MLVKGQQRLWGTDEHSAAMLQPAVPEIRFAAVNYRQFPSPYFPATNPSCASSY